MTHFLSLCIFALLFSVSSVNAQEIKVTAEPFFAGTAQPTVVKIPLPSYPKEAKKINLSGRVSVSVSVDESGNVASVTDVEGPYPVCKSVATAPVLALRLVASNAAKEAKFSPTVAGGQGVWATGRINYDFSMPDLAEAKAGDSSSIAGLAISDFDTGATVGTARVTTGAKVPYDGKDPRMASGGVLNGKATALPKPPYPPAARAVRAGGAVSVQVIIDEEGNIYLAQALSGHPLLRRSSEIAACASTFLPTLLSGHPVKVSGVIVYNYVP